VKLAAVLILLLAAGAPDSEEAKARRVCYWGCIRRERCRDASGSCCMCRCAQECSLIRNGCPECRHLHRQPGACTLKNYRRGAK
jgi:hypothetical protein